MIGSVISVQVGQKMTYNEENRHIVAKKSWTTASYKYVKEGAVAVRFNGLDGDEVADTVHHGGIDKAVFANSYENYPIWSRFLGIDTLPFGALSENVTLSKLHERSVTLGEIHRIGTAILQVSQPRKPCWKISRRWNNIDFTSEIYTSGLTGWYYKVLEEGAMQAGDSVHLLQKEDQSISILEANKAFKEPIEGQKTLEAILMMTALAPSYLKSIATRLKGESDLSYMKMV